MVEVKAVVKRGAKTFPAYLMLFLSGTVVGGLTERHSMGEQLSACSRERLDAFCDITTQDARSQGHVLSTPIGSFQVQEVSNSRQPSLVHHLLIWKEWLLSPLLTGK